MTTERTTSPSQDAHGTARLPNPSTDQRVEEVVARLRRYTRSQMGAISEVLEGDAQQAADLLTRLSAELDRLEGERNVAQRDVLDRIAERDRALDLYSEAKARAERAESDRDALGQLVQSVEQERDATAAEAVKTAERLIAERDALKVRAFDFIAWANAEAERCKGTVYNVAYLDCARRAAELHATLSGERCND